MKKYIRIIGVVLCIAVIGMTLCSCSVLDQAKEGRAEYTDGSKESIVFRGCTYNRLGKLDSGDLSFIMNDTAFGYHAVTKDIPLLVTSMEGDLLLFEETDYEKKEAPALMGVYINENSDSDSSLPVFEEYYVSKEYSNLTYFIREDQFDKVKELIKDTKVDHYYISVTEYYNIKEPWRGGKNVKHVLDDATTAALEHTLSDGEKIHWDEINDDYWESCVLYSCDKDAILTDGRMYDLVKSELDYYICDYSVNADSSVLYKVSADDYELIRKLFKECYENNSGYVDPEWYSSDDNIISSDEEEIVLAF